LGWEESVIAPDTDECEVLALRWLGLEPRLVAKAFRYLASSPEGFLMKIYFNDQMK
jgi:hypothetical protein